MIYTIDNPKLVKNAFVLRTNFTGVVKDNSGIIAYYVDDKFHREDGPAIIWKDGTVHYYINDKLHRDNGPAIIKADKTVIYYNHGQIHRVGGPAVILTNEEYFYYLYDDLHREDGPAVVQPGGIKEYWLNGKYIDVNTDEDLKDYLILRMFK